MSARTLSVDEFEELLLLRSPESTRLLKDVAQRERQRVYQNRVFVRGLLEISNHCKNNCLYCGLRAENSAVCRFRLKEEEILSCCKEGYGLGLRTFVLQGGEDAHFTDKRLTELIKAIKASCPGAAVTLSLGERSRESYAALKKAGADRYLLRHETANEEHYARLHPKEMSAKTRMKALQTLKELDFQVGAGFMVGSPYQTTRNLAEDLHFVSVFRPQMCGIGPFLPQKDTPFGTEPAGDVDLTLYLLSILRIIDPALLLPATTALATANEKGHVRGILHGANVIMPNLSPLHARENYRIYDGKKSSGPEAAEGLSLLKDDLHSAGFELDLSRGDYETRKG